MQLNELLMVSAHVPWKLRPLLGWGSISIQTRRCHWALGKLLRTSLCSLRLMGRAGGVALVPPFVEGGGVVSGTIGTQSGAAVPGAQTLSQLPLAT